MKRKYSEDEVNEETLNVDEPSQVKKSSKPLPPGYTCKACGAVDEHAIYNCPLKISKKTKSSQESSGHAQSSIPQNNKSKIVAVAPAVETEKTEEAEEEKEAKEEQPKDTSFIKTIFLSGLPFTATKDRVLKMIKDAATAKEDNDDELAASPCQLTTRDIILLTFPDNPNRCKGIGYVNCSTVADFHRAQLLHGTSLGKLNISAVESSLPYNKEASSPDVAHAVPVPVANNSKLRCYRCGGKHEPKTCTNERICYRCRGTGHLSSQCPHKVRK